MKDILELLAMAVTPTGGNTHQENQMLDLLYPALRKLFMDCWDELPEQFSQVFHVQTSDKRIEEDFEMGNFGLFSKFQEADKVYGDAEALPTVQYKKISTGTRIPYIHDEYAQGFIVDRKIQDDNNISLVQKMTKDLSYAAKASIEEIAATVINTGFTSNGYDLVPLFSDKHPLLDSAEVCSNIVYADTLTADVIAEMIRVGKTAKDNAGKKIMFNFDRIVCSANLEFKMREILNSVNKAHEDSNTKNVLPSLTLTVLDYLEDDIVMVQDSRRHELNFFHRIKPELNKEKDIDTHTHRVNCYFRNSVGYSNWRGVCACKIGLAKPAALTAKAKK